MIASQNSGSLLPGKKSKACYSHVDFPQKVGTICDWFIVYLSNIIVKMCSHWGECYGFTFGTQLDEVNGTLLSLTNMQQ